MSVCISFAQWVYGAILDLIIKRLPAPSSAGTPPFGASAARPLPLLLDVRRMCRRPRVRHEVRDPHDERLGVLREGMVADGGHVPVL